LSSSDGTNLSTDHDDSTGSTGYIGGTVLDTLVRQRPNYSITALLRKVPAQFAEKYPDVKIVIGDYDDFEFIAKNAAEADIVVRE
jgi:nucleoside-diphosphate-sugar epimerase